MIGMAVKEESGGVRDTDGKPAKQSFWNLQNVTALIALGSFCFGIGTWSDLRHRLAPDAGDVRQRYAATHRLQYITDADARCGRTVSLANRATPSISYDWMNNILTLRRQMASDWSRAGLLSLAVTNPTDAASVRKMYSDYLTANAFWAATADNLKASDVAGYNTNLGLFTMAEGTFHDEATRFGFKTCSFAWPTVPPWQ